MEGREKKGEGDRRWGKERQKVREETAVRRKKRGGGVKEGEERVGERRQETEEEGKKERKTRVKGT